MSPSTDSGTSTSTWSTWSDSEVVLVCKWGTANQMSASWIFCVVVCCFFYLLFWTSKPMYWDICLNVFEVQESYMYVKSIHLDPPPHPNFTFPIIDICNELKEKKNVELHVLLFSNWLPSSAGLWLRKSLLFICLPDYLYLCSCYGWDINKTLPSLLYISVAVVMLLTLWLFSEFFSNMFQWTVCHCLCFADHHNLANKKIGSVISFCVNCNILTSSWLSFIALSLCAFCCLSFIHSQIIFCVNSLLAAVSKWLIQWQILFA